MSSSEIEMNFASEYKTLTLNGIVIGKGNTFSILKIFITRTSLMARMSLALLSTSECGIAALSSKSNGIILKLVLE